MTEHRFGFRTRALHAGGTPDAATGARAVPIYHTSSFVFDDAADAGNLFALQKYGNIYSRIGNPTVAALEEHPIRAFRDAGVTVTVHSDDPSMFGTTLNNEYVIAAGLLDLDEEGVRDLARASVLASFAPRDVAARLLDEIDAYRG